MNNGKRYNLIVVSFATYIPVGEVRKWCANNSIGNRMTVDEVRRMQKEVREVNGARDNVAKLRQELKYVDRENMIRNGVWRKEFDNP